MSFYSELKRRNVFKVAIVYLAVAWLLLQVSDTLGPALRLPEWFVSAVVFLLILGFPIALLFAWAFELTPDGLKPETGADSSTPAVDSSTRLNGIVIAALVIALGYFVLDKFAFKPDIDPAEHSQVGEAAERKAAASDIRENSIAVLPFVNMSSDAEQEYFSDGLSEELLNLLARIPELDVAARTSSFAFKGKTIALPDIASQLNVAHVLEGSVRKHGNKLRITAQLIQADNGYHLWSEAYDRELDNVFQIQEDIATAVVDALRVTLLGDAPTVRKTDPLAYQYFLEGHYLKRQLSGDSLDRAVEAFRQAVTIDPGYVPAWAELADTYLWGGGWRELTRVEAVALADEAINIAIETDPDYAFAYYVRGVSEMFSRRNFKQGIVDFERALELDPNDAVLVAAIGKGAFLTGDYERAIEQYRLALSMEPVVPEFYYFMGRAYLSAGRLDEAEQSFRKLISLSPSWRGNYQLWETYLLRRDFDAALQLADSAFEKVVTYHAMGDSEQSDQALAELKVIDQPYLLALAYGYRGEVDKTFEHLFRELAASGGLSTFLMTEPAFRSIYADPRWEDVLAETGLLDFWRINQRTD